MKNFSVLIVAAGEGSRFGVGTPKQFLSLAGQSILSRSVSAFSEIQGCTKIVVVIAPAHRQRFQDVLNKLPADVILADGGATRRESVYQGLQAFSDLTEDDLILIHDAARPLVSRFDIQAVIDGSESGAASLARRVADTLYSETSGSVDRNNLWAIQTPQAFYYGQIKTAHESVKPDERYTDDTGLVMSMSFPVKFIEATKPNFKITTTEDFNLAEHILSTELPIEIRTGQGYDVHAFDKDTNNIKSIRLCGIDIPFDRKLAGHSDADVGLHALTDALLGAIGEGDIGLHFPPSNMTFKNMDSAVFLKHALKLMTDKGARILNADVTLICEQPKIGPYRDLLSARMAEILEIATSRVNIKATTTEKLGFTGRMEGIAAQAIVTLSILAPKD